MSSGLIYGKHKTCQNVMKLEFYQQFFKKYSNTKFHENPSSGSRVVPWGRTDIMNLIVAFCNFAKAPKDMLQF